jgi:transcription initiation factor TFIID subunit 11
MKTVSGSKVSPEAVLVMGGITKVFVCEVVECARTVMNEWGEAGPIRPAHLREAYRRLKREGKIDSPPTYKKQLFKR